MIRVSSDFYLKLGYRFFWSTPKVQKNKHHCNRTASRTSKWKSASRRYVFKYFESIHALFKHVLLVLMHTIQEINLVRQFSLSCEHKANVKTRSSNKRIIDFFLIVLINRVVMTLVFNLLIIFNCVYSN